MGYFVRYLIYVLVIGAAWLGTDVLCAQITGNCAAVLIGRMIVSVLVPNLSFLAVYARTAEFTFLMGKACMQRVEQAARGVVRTGYRLLFLTKYLTEILKEHGITAITLKGASTASFYPVPELRKSGDVDILITDAAKCEQACRLLAEEGFLSSGHQLTIHHGDFQSISPRTAIMHFI